jgi:hypothetical protein
MKILGMEYKIEEVSGFDGFGHELNDLGEVNKCTCVIRLNENMAPDVKKAILLHETLHVLADSLAIELTEEKVQALGFALYSVLKENGIDFNITK